MWDPIVSVPDHCLSFYFELPDNFKGTGGAVFTSFQRRLTIICQWKMATRNFFAPTHGGST